MVIASGLIVPFLIFLLQEVRPPDPAHPMSFDFLLKPITVYPWLAICVVTAVGLVTWFARRTRFDAMQRNLEVAQNEVQRLKSVEREFATHKLDTEAELHAHEHRIKDLTQTLRKGDDDRIAKAKRIEDLEAKIAPVPTALVAPQTIPAVAAATRADEREAFIATHDDFRIRIARESTGQNHRLVLTLLNDRLTVLAKYRATIRTCRSFDARHNDYRDGREFSAVYREMPNPILASYTSAGFVIVHNRQTDPRLFAGENDQQALIWPANDQSSVQRWKMEIELIAFAMPPQPNTQPPALPLVRFSLTVLWNPAVPDITIEKVELGSA